MDDTWTTGLYACTTDPPGCFDALCCPFCALSRQFRATSGDAMSWSVPVLLISPVAYPCLCLALRRRVVRKYHIDEDTVLSVCTVIFCGLCSGCQVHRELTQRNVPPGLNFPWSRLPEVPYTAMR
jgi:Cys-rich protein (TIGR01571 family)